MKTPPPSPTTCTRLSYTPGGVGASQAVTLSSAPEFAYGKLLFLTVLMFMRLKIRRPIHFEKLILFDY